ncbi:Ataxin-10 [Galemys pyrenaicus]|uniref:Ataxin-10 n=1 Tax=Galemys pyrenaicus TaxID=202257 RepID=A0A8J6AIP3_GALPY|nr:Ataxin-10 [Galemys pyrenaicus]
MGLLVACSKRGCGRRVAVPVRAAVLSGFSPQVPEETRWRRAEKAGLGSGPGGAPRRPLRFPLCQPGPRAASAAAPVLHRLKAGLARGWPSGPAGCPSLAGLSAPPGVGAPPCTAGLRLSRCISLHQTSPLAFRFLIVTDHFLKSPELVKAMYAKMSNQERVTLLDLTIARVAGDEPLPADDVPAFLGHAQLVASTFVDRCRAVLRLSSEPHAEDEEALTTIRLLDILCEMTTHVELLRGLQAFPGLLEGAIDLLRLIHISGNDAANIFSTAGCIKGGGDVANTVEGFKSHLIRLIGNLCYKHKENQDKVGGWRVRGLWGRVSTTAGVRRVLTFSEWNVQAALTTVSSGPWPRVVPGGRRRVLAGPALGAHSAALRLGAGALDRNCGQCEVGPGHGWLLPARLSTPQTQREQCARGVGTRGVRAVSSPLWPPVPSRRALRPPSPCFCLGQRRAGGGGPCRVGTHLAATVGPGASGSTPDSGQLTVVGTREAGRAQACQRWPL